MPLQPDVVLRQSVRILEDGTALLPSAARLNDLNHHDLGVVTRTYFKVMYSTS